MRTLECSQWQRAANALNTASKHARAIIKHETLNTDNKYGDTMCLKYNTVLLDAIYMY